MSSKDIAAMCVQNLLRRKGRTFLTVLGVFIGCCSIIVMVSLGIGMKESQEKMLAQMGDLTIIEVSPQQGGHGQIKLNDKSVTTFEAMEGVEAVTPKMSMDNFSIKLYAGLNRRYVCDWTTLMGLNSRSMDKMGYILTDGKKISVPADEVIAGNYLAYNFRDTMKPDGMNMVDRWSSYDENGQMGELPDPFFKILDTPIIMEIDLGDNKKFEKELKAVGVTKEDYSKGYETSDGMMMDISALKELLTKIQPGGSLNLSYSSVLVKVKDINTVEAVENQIKAIGYNTSSMESIRKPMEKEARQKQLMLGGLGAISLFVAALGITNTMIMSISERTREIGIMKSLGCYVKDIRAIFLAEAGAIGFIGGIIGCIVSMLISVAINMVSQGIISIEGLLAVLMGGPEINRLSVVPLWLLGFAVVFSIAIGLCSGYYPANKAVKISALEAIKNE